MLAGFSCRFVCIDHHEAKQVTIPHVASAYFFIITTTKKVFHDIVAYEGCKIAPIQC